MRIHNIYADENGETHFRDIEVDLSEVGPDGTTSNDSRRPGSSFARLRQTGSSTGTRQRDDNT
jgi:hypothetical protein